jgi:hypothetical protein
VATKWTVCSHPSHLRTADHLHGNTLQLGSYRDSWPESRERGVESLRGPTERAVAAASLGGAEQPDVKLWSKYCCTDRARALQHSWLLVVWIGSRLRPPAKRQLGLSGRRQRAFDALLP